MFSEHYPLLSGEYISPRGEIKHINCEYNEGLRKVNILLIGSQTFRYSALRHKPFSQTVRELSESFEGLVST